MNALPVKRPTPQDMIDDLIAEFGMKRVVLVTIARLFKRTRPPNLEKQPDVDMLSDRMRADIGLPPQEHSQMVHIDPLLGQRMF